MKYVVKMYEPKYDDWVRITSPDTKEYAESIWDILTKEGTEHICYSDGRYFDVFNYE